MMLPIVAPKLLMIWKSFWIFWLFYMSMMLLQMFSKLLLDLSH